MSNNLYQFGFGLFGLIFRKLKTQIKPNSFYINYYNIILVNINVKLLKPNLIYRAYNVSYYLLID